MDIKILKSFIAVAKHLSFSEAAQELHTVQPAISCHISSLEEQLGVSLFTRNSREVSITQAGEQLVKDATAILALTERAKNKVKLVDSGQLGSLSIAYLSSACLTFLAKLIRTYKSQFPNVHVTLLEMTATEQIEALKNERVDVAFSRPLPSTIADEFISETMYVDRLVAVVNKNHPFASTQTINLKTLKNEPFILFNRDEALGLFDEIITRCKRAGFSPNIISQPRHMQTLVTEVAAGLGLAIAPYCVSKLYSEGYHFIELEKVDTQIYLQLQYKQINSSASTPAFVEMALNAQAEIQLSMRN